jgi:hypothetical protein
MALHWSIERVRDWKEIAEDDEQRKITEAVVWAALVYRRPLARLSRRS